MKHLSKLLLVCGTVLFAACGDKKDAKNDAVSQDDLNQTSVQTRPEHSAGSLSNSDTVTISGHKYIVNVRRYEDSSLPTVRDDTGVEFYDNKVEISILYDGDKSFTRTFEKADFADKASEADRNTGVMLGMAFDAEMSAPGELSFTASIGQPNIEDGGSGFRVTINPFNGSVGIKTEVLKSETGYAEEEDA